MENIDKKRVTVYLDMGLVEMCHLNVDNLSQLINSLLTSYLSVSSVEEIQKQIEEYHSKIKALSVKQQDLIKSGVSENGADAMIKQINDELQKAYVLRRTSSGNNQDMDFEWANSPKNLQRCKLLGKEPLELVMELRKWYDVKGGEK
jgi:two-component sensor histidine kinase